MLQAIRYKHCEGLLRKAYRVWPEAARLLFVYFYRKIYFSPCRAMFYIAGNSHMAGQLRKTSKQIGYASGQINA
jgi:hypothetical protein